MVAGDRIERLLEEVRDLGILKDARFVNTNASGSRSALEGEVLVEGYEPTVRINLLTSFPLTLPYFELCPWDALGYIPHVLRDSGTICFRDREGTILNRREPLQIITAAFKLAVDVLRDGVADKNECDFADEFDVHWGWIEGCLVCRSVLEAGGCARHVIVAVDRLDEQRRYWIADSLDNLANYHNGAPIERFEVAQKAIFLPLEAGTVIFPPHPDQSFWTVEDTRNALVLNLTEKTVHQLRHLTKGRKHDTEYVIAELPRPSGGSTLFGIRFESVRGPHPLREGGRAAKLTPLQLRRLDHGYLVERGGGDASLKDKRALLVGCGAVGGHIAFELARAGVLDLTFVDWDRLTEDNSFRHVLGRQYWRRPKVEALKEEIEAQLPYVRVTAIRNFIEDAIASQAINLLDFDLIVVALGNPTVELDINERLHTLGSGPPAIFAWLEPLGIGGHALLTNNSEDSGCFECLYTPASIDEEISLTNRASFAAPGQSFGRALTGCGSLHTPYGSADAVRTAGLVVHLAINALAGKEPRNPLVSWRGDATAFESAGYTLTSRHSVSDDQLAGQRYAYQSPHCPICGDIANGND